MREQHFYEIKSQEAAAPCNTKRPDWCFNYLAETPGTCWLLLDNWKLLKFSNDKQPENVFVD
jgi:hypothetical protein